MTGTALDPRRRAPRTPVPASADRNARTPSPGSCAWLRRPRSRASCCSRVRRPRSRSTTRGTLGTDTGGKLATLHMMERNGGLDPDVGYWAQRSTPRRAPPAALHVPVGGKWVNVTTLPMLYAAYPLYRLGGDRAVLLLPMLGALLCAFAAAGARRVGSARRRLAAFWVVGLASPVAIYALDFWEHTLGLGLMLWGVVCCSPTCRHGRVRAAGAVGRRCAVRRGGDDAHRGPRLPRGRDGLTVPRDALARAVARTPGGHRSRAWWLRVAMLVGERLLEQLILGADLRGGTRGRHRPARRRLVGDRLHEAVTTSVGLGLSARSTRGGGHRRRALLGAGRLAARGPRLLLGAAAFAGACVLLTPISQGLGFVPGMVTASPFAAVGLLLAWRHPRCASRPRSPRVALPVVWASSSRVARHRSGAVATFCSRAPCSRSPARRARRPTGRSWPR